MSRKPTPEPQPESPAVNPEPQPESPAVSPEPQPEHVEAAKKRAANPANLAPLKAERIGYVRRGLTDRVAQVDALIGAIKAEDVV
jgi:hypothetical protein